MESLCPLWFFVFFVILLEHNEHQEPQRTGRVFILQKKEADFRQPLYLNLTSNLVPVILDVFRNIWIGVFFILRYRE